MSNIVYMLFHHTIYLLTKEREMQDRDTRKRIALANLYMLLNKPHKAYLELEYGEGVTPSKDLILQAAFELLYDLDFKKAHALFMRTETLPDLHQMEELAQDISRREIPQSEAAEALSEIAGWIDAIQHSHGLEAEVNEPQNYVENR